jgi:hypothetical protein
VKPYCENNLQLQVVELDETDPTHFFVMNEPLYALISKSEILLSPPIEYCPE